MVNLSIISKRDKLEDLGSNLKVNQQSKAVLVQNIDTTGKTILRRESMILWRGLYGKNCQNIAKPELTTAFEQRSPANSNRNFVVTFSINFHNNDLKFRVVVVQRQHCILGVIYGRVQQEDIFPLIIGF